MLALLYPVACLAYLLRDLVPVLWEVTTFGSEDGATQKPARVQPWCRGHCCLPVVLEDLFKTNDIAKSKQVPAFLSAIGLFPARRPSGTG